MTSSMPSGSVTTAVNVTDSPSVMVSTFLPSTRICGAPATGEPLLLGLVLPPPAPLLLELVVPLPLLLVVELVVAPLLLVDVVAEPPAPPSPPVPPEAATHLPALQTRVSL